MNSPDLQIMFLTSLEINLSLAFQRLQDFTKFIRQIRAVKHKEEQMGAEHHDNYVASTI